MMRKMERTSAPPSMGCLGGEVLGIGDVVVVADAFGEARGSDVLRSARKPISMNTYVQPQG